MTYKVLHSIVKGKVTGSKRNIIFLQVGESTATTELIVYGPPIFNHEKTQYAVLGKEALIACSLSSYPGIKQVVRLVTIKFIKT